MLRSNILRVSIPAVLAAVGVFWVYNKFRPVAHARYPKQTQHFSKEFVLAAGAIAFFLSKNSPLRVCLVHFTKNRDEWLLAKGRKDEGEDLAAAALRETLEETGYSCKLLEIPELLTRATIPSSIAGLAHQHDIPRIATNSTEPFCITLRPLQAYNNIKLIFWYVAVIDDIESEAGPKVGTHMHAEGFEESGLFEIEDALERLTFETDKDLLRQAAVYARQAHAALRDGAK